MLSDNLRKTRKFLKENVLQNKTLLGCEKETEQILHLLRRSVDNGESNSAVLIGPRGAGKTTLVNNIIGELQQCKSFDSKAFVVHLNGFVHVDDRLTLQSIASQLNLDNAADGKVFGSFAENLAFLLACLKSGERKSAKSIIFVIDEFDLFCGHHNQTLLYNLFDVAQSAQTPLCIIGVTCRFDVIELFEKRVKSRFSHRQFFLFPKITNLDDRLKRIEHLLLIPNDVDLPVSYRKSWNCKILELTASKKFQSLMQRLLNIDPSESTLKNTLIMIISGLNDKKCFITLKDFQDQLSCLEKEDLVKVILDLNVLQLCLLIAMKHHIEIYDNNAVNFEMVLTRYTKFANANSNMQIIERPVVLKAFEHLENTELISLVHPSGDKLQREYKLYKLLVTPSQILEAINKSSALPTEVVQWANSSLI